MHFRRSLAYVRSIFSSFEKRLIGALGFIILATLGVQLVSVYMARSYSAEVDSLAAASLRSEQAAQLANATQDFRLAAYRMEAAGNKERTRGYDELTDAAVRVSALVGRLRNSGVLLYEGNVATASFDEIDKVVEHFNNRHPTSDKRSLVERELTRLGKAAQMIAAQQLKARSEAYRSFDQRVRQRFVVVTGAGVLVLLLVFIILLDLSLNILPEIRAMHDTLRRLSEGELDAQVPISRLSELSALSAALETVRRNAVTVNDLAYKDPSTGLPNRRAFVERAATCLRTATASGTNFALIHADIDGFKLINDEFGHATGDELIALIGKRMLNFCGPDAIVARVGGDEFAIFVLLPATITGIGFAQAIVAEMRKPLSLGEISLVATLSMGVAEVVSDGGFGDSPEDEILNLLSRADLALYASKSSGRNRAMSFTTELEERRNLRRALERDLARGLAEGQFRMVYQPIVAADNNPEYREVEALVRWNHPTLGSIPPSRFIALAEGCGLMNQLGAWIIDRVLADHTKWPEVRVSINLSPLQLQQDGFVGMLLSACAKHGNRPQQLSLEVTESISIESDSRALLTLELLRQSGFRIALDDFGTGYSSLNLLKLFRFDRLKLDRSLIIDLDKDPAAQAVFDAAVIMALTMNAEVVAEGISDGAVAGQVIRAGCTHLQGYYYSEPIEAVDIPFYFDQTKRACRRIA